MGVTKALAAALMVGSAAADLPSIVAKGSKFFYPNGTQFYIKGIAYQQDSAAAGASTGSTMYTDPLADQAACTRDVPVLAAAGTNVIRTYAIDPTKDHSACMTLLQNAGIYVISDLSSPVPGESINRDSATWDTQLLSRYTAVIDEMSKYSNVIGFFAGNEVTSNNTNTEASAFVKAAVRDSKAYIKKNVNRWMGVGYAANDDADIRANMAQYFNCGDQSSAIDFWGYNIYEWCGHSTFQQSGYSAQVDFFKNYSVPVFFAEYGCNTQGGAAARLFEETTELYSSDMTGDISGGIVYMYFEEANDYGLVSIDGSNVTPNKGYTSLSSRIAAATPTAVQSSSYNPSNSPAACPSIGAAWQAASALPPTPDAGLCSCMFQSVQCKAAPTLNTTAFGDIFSYVCGQSPSSCAGILQNTTTGVYGSYSMCNATEKLGYVLDQYYKSQNSASTACDFGGQAMTNAGSVSSQCSASISSASASNSVAATATGAAAATSSNIAAPVPMQNAFTLGGLAVGLYVVVAMGAGAAMIAL